MKDFTERIGQILRKEWGGFYRENRTDYTETIGQILKRE